MAWISSEDAAQILRVFMASAGTLGLATVNETGGPHACNVNFAADADLNLYFVSNPASAHAQHIARNPKIAASAYAPFHTPDQIRGVQLRGACEPIGAGEFDFVWRIFRNRFPYAGQMEDRVRREQFYRIRPEWFRYIDNAVAFGYRWETDWPPADQVATP